MVQEYVGQGAFGPVYRGFDPSVGSVAVKVLSSLSAPAAVDRFRVVAPQLVTLRHPNLASVLEYGEHEGTPYLIVEYVAGGTLADRMRSPAVSQLGVVSLLEGAAAGIDQAHRTGFVHGALGPRQILLGPDDHPFVTDFGLAPLRREAEAQVAGPAEMAYLAPEQVSTGTATAASDRYAFAAIAYHLLTGRAPFDDFADGREALLNLEPPPPSRRNPALGPATDAVLLRGLAKEPGARWQTCTQMTEALAEALRRDGPAAVVAPVAVPAARRRSPWPWIAGAVVVVALIAAAVLLWLANQPKAPGITLSSSTVRAGDPVTVSANHLPASQVGTIELQSASVQVGTFQADQNGNALQQVTIPASTSPGDHLLTLCWNGSCPASARLAVTERAPTPSPTPSPTPTRIPTPVPTPIPTPTPPPTSPPATPGLRTPPTP
jgi:serine/threonine-protein kinase